MLEWLRKLGGAKAAPDPAIGDERERSNSPSATGSGSAQQAPPGVQSNSVPVARKPELRPVPGALVASAGGHVIYNMLTPHMQQFMGRSVSAIKKSGLKAKGTGNFSILVGEQQAELQLDRFYQPTDDPALIEDAVAAAKQLTGTVQ